MFSFEIKASPSTTRYIVAEFW